jgi:hypothetical protein
MKNLIYLTLTTFLSIQALQASVVCAFARYDWSKREYVTSKSCRVPLMASVVPANCVESSYQLLQRSDYKIQRVINNGQGIEMTISELNGSSRSMTLYPDSTLKPLNVIPDLAVTCANSLEVKISAHHSL